MSRRALLPVVGLVCVALVSALAVVALAWQGKDASEEGLEPLASLRETRSGKVLGWDKVPGLPGGAVFFATNLLARQRGVVRIGDRVAITARREGAPMPLAA